MLIVDEADIADILCCPRCKGTLVRANEPGQAWRCISAECALSMEPFPSAGGKSLFVDFENSVLDRDDTIRSAGQSILPRRPPWRRRFFEKIDGGNPIAPHFAADILARAATAGQAEGRKGRLLIVGGGAVGSGSEALYQAEQVEVVAFDVYRSEHVTFIADGHAMPVKSGAFDCVWIQAVLEHVVDPMEVVAEIARVLAPGGVVFADTPFMWPVHEAAYDFTRWTPSGHRWLFRQFDVVDAGVSSGPGRTALVALRHLFTALTRSPKAAQLCVLPLFWLRFLDRYCDKRAGLDACAGLFFYGTKRETPLQPKDLIVFYDQQVALQARAQTYA